MLKPQIVLIDMALTILLGFAGAGVAWLMRRRTDLAARNFYPPAGLAVVVLALLVSVRAWTVAMVMLPLASPWIAGAIAGRRWRGSDLGAGEELRNHELAVG